MFILPALHNIINIILPGYIQCTTSYFEGTIALVDPQGSWVAKWQRIGKHDSSLLFYNSMY